MELNYLLGINYLLVSSLLLLLGGLIFAFLQHKMTAKQNKLIINFLLVTALFLPCCLPDIPNYMEGLNDAQTFDYHSYNQWNVVNINDSSLVACYEKSKNSRDFCQCEIVQKSNLWAYRPNWWREGLIFILPLLAWLIAGAFLFFGLKLFIQWLQILWLIVSKKRQKINFQGFDIWLVYATEGYEAACFNGLGANYLFWSENLAQLPQEEKEQIFVHELAHLKDKDGWFLLLWQLVQLIFWANPAYYYLKRKLAEANEFAADAAVLEQPVYTAKNYARLLLKLKLAQINPKSCLNLFFAKSLLHSRISRMLGADDKPSSTIYPVYAWGLMVLFLFWQVAKPTNAYLQSENIAFYQYDILKTANQKTGLTHICVDCISKK